jgi:hypothetical protein
MILSRRRGVSRTYLTRRFSVGKFSQHRDVDGRFHAAFTSRALTSRTAVPPFGVRPRDSWPARGTGLAREEGRIQDAGCVARYLYYGFA